MDADEFGNITFDDGKVAVVNPASERSLSYFKSLTESKELEPLFKGFAEADNGKAWNDLFIQAHNVLVAKTPKQVADMGCYAQKDISMFITALKTCPKKPKSSQYTDPMANQGKPMNYGADDTATTPATEPAATPATTQVTKITEDGMYKHGGDIYKVQWNLNETRLYAKRLRVLPNGKVKFVYARGIMGVLTPADRLSMKDAAEFGLMYGTCCICGRTLTNELSIHLGIGPVCGDREFGGEFAFMQTAKQAELAGTAPTKITEDPRLKDPEFMALAFAQLQAQQDN